MVQRLWRFGGSPQRTSSKQLSIGTPGSNVLDTRLLQQLKLICALRPAALLSLTADGSLKDMPVQVLLRPYDIVPGLDLVRPELAAFSSSH